MKKDNITTQLPEYDTNFLILGGGPAGLSFAHSLKRQGINSFIVLEKENEAGGLCRSQIVDGAAIDIGGGHFLDVKRQSVVDFLFDFMPKEKWNLFDRKSAISLGEYTIDYPLESNIWQLPESEQEKYLESIAKTGESKGEPMPEMFGKWIYWKFGDRISQKYMIPYNEKIWSIDVDKLGTYWLYKLPEVKHKEILESCNKKSAVGTIPAHSKFYYPKTGGFGQLWNIMADNLGESIRYKQKVKHIDLSDNRILIKTEDAKYNANILINTIPWHEFLNKSNMPENIIELINKLEYSSIEVGYYSENIDNEYHWVYVPDIEKSHHRILNRRAFVTDSRGHWTETNIKRLNMDRRNPEWYNINKYAYPLNTVDKPETIRNIINWFKNYNVYALGRWGEWEHMNSDVVVERAMNLANELTKNNLSIKKSIQ